MLLTRDEVAKRLRVSTKTVYRLVKAGDLRPVRLTEGGHPRFTEDEVERFIAERAAS